MGRTLGARSRATALVCACAVALSCVASEGRAEMGSWQSLDVPNNTLVIGEVIVQRWIAEPLIQAAETAGVDPAYIMALADKESSLRPLARARTSSAEGLFQFVEDTWFHVIRRYARRHGLTGAADALKTADGRPVPEEQRTWLLNLRRDPYISALMVAEMIKEHREVLGGLTERAPSETELYVAHFLGLNGAARFVKLLETNPQQSAPRAFPKAAKANETIFFEATKKKRRKALSVGDVWARLNEMIARRIARYASLRRAGVSSDPSACTPADTRRLALIH